MKKTPLAIALAALAFSGGAAAETLSATTSLAGSCTFSDTVTGSLVVSGTSVTTDAAAKASTKVTNNDPNGFDVVIGTATSTFPGALTMATKNVNVTLTSGPTPAFPDTSNEGQAALLGAAGEYDFDFDFSSTLSASAIAGAYTMASDVTCVATGGG